MPPRTHLAIFVGGQSARMGVPKGLLQTPDGEVTILEKLVSCARQADLIPFLVGDALAYDQLVTEVTRISDRPPRSGPLGGLKAAFEHTLEARARTVIAVACDMPHVSTEALLLLRDHPTEAPVLAPRRRPEAPWEPMLARYDAVRMLPVLDAAIANGCQSFQRLFSEVDVWPLELTASVLRSLEDWDTPADVVRADRPAKLDR